MIAHILLAALLATVAVTTPSGATVEAEIAATPQSRERGLMGRDTLDEDSGMLFVFPEDGTYSFWMKNTRIPLDIIWLDTTHKVLFISRDTPPCPVMRVQCPTYGPDIPARYVLKVGAGRGAELVFARGFSWVSSSPTIWNLEQPVAAPESTVVLQNSRTTP